MNRRRQTHTISVGVLTFGLGALTTAGLATAAPAVPATRPAAPVTVPAAAATFKVATADEIRSAYEAGRWDDVLRALPPVLSLTGKAAEGYDRHELLRIKGETLLRKRSGQQAASAFRQAADLAPDPTAAAADRATGLLLSRSTADLTYQPRTSPNGRSGGGARPAIDVVAAEPRKAALAALFEDELAARRPQIEAAAATEVRSFESIDPLLAVLRDLRALELAATGYDRIVADLTVGIDVKAARLLKAAMEPVTASAERVKAEATQWRRADGFFIAGQQFGMRGPTITPSFELAGGKYQARAADKQVGLNPATSAELRRVAAACENVAARAAACIDAFGNRQKEFEDVGRQAEETDAAASTLLDHNWRAVRVRFRPLTDDELVKKSKGR